MSRKTITTTPWMDSMVAAVQEHLSTTRRRKVSYSEAVAWIVDDFNWCAVNMPAFGRMSPVMEGIVAKLLEANS